MNIYIGNLPFTVKEDELKGIFEQYGEVESVKIITDKFTGRSKGFGFIDMPNESDGNNAIEALNGSDVNGRNVKVNQAQEKRNDNRRNFRR